MFYAATNRYASQTSYGFSNTWSVLGFATRAMRDAYVARATDLATRAISSAEISKYGGKRGLVDYYDAKGDFWMWCPGSYGSKASVGYGSHSIDPVTARPVKGEWAHQY